MSANPGGHRHDKDDLAQEGTMTVTTAPSKTAGAVES